MPLISLRYSIPYLFLLLFLFFFSFKISITDSKYNLSVNSLWQKKAVFYVLCFFVCFRGFIAYDYCEYYPYYSHVPCIQDGLGKILYFITKEWWGYRWEKGFVLFTVLTKSISSSYFFYQFVSSILFFIVLFYILKEYLNDYFLLGVFCFVVFDGFDIVMNLERNSKSMICFFLSLKYLQRNNFKKYFLLNLLGFFFHFSSIVYIPVYFIVRRKYSFRFFAVLFLIGFLIFTFHIKWISPILLRFCSFIPGRIGKLVITYLGSARWGTRTVVSIGFLEKVLTILLFLFSYKKIYKKNFILLNFLALFFFSFFYFSELLILVARIPKLFVFSYWFFYPIFYRSLRKDLKYFFVLFFFLYSAMKAAFSYWNVCFWYENILVNYSSFSERLYLSNLFRIASGQPAKILH